MTNPRNATKLKYLILCAGLLGGGLRAILYLTGTDAKGLLISGHWAHTAIWALAAAMGCILTAVCFRIPKDALCRRPGPVGALGCFPAALAFLQISLTGFRMAESRLETASAVLGCAAAAALVWGGICRLRRKPSIFLCNALVCLCFALRMVCQYRTWSSDPQLQDYCFIMLSHVGLMLTAYYFAEFDAGMGRLRPAWFVGLAAAYFSLAGLWNSQEPLLMLCCALWVLTNLPPVCPRRTHPVPTPEEE